jgi:hypothetical protein
VANAIICLAALQVVVTTITMLPIVREAVHKYRPCASLAAVLADICQSDVLQIALGDGVVISADEAKAAICSCVLDIDSQQDAISRMDEYFTLPWVGLTTVVLNSQQTASTSAVLNSTVLLQNELWADERLQMHADLQQLQLEGPELVSAIWKKSKPVPVESNFPLFVIFTASAPCSMQCA